MADLLTREEVALMLDELDEPKSIEEWGNWLDRNNPLLEMHRRDGGVGERRAWPRTSLWRDFLIMARPALIVFLGAMLFLALFAIAVEQGHLDL